MRIVNLQTFLTYPEGTIFMEVGGTYGEFEGLYVKLESEQQYFLYRSLISDIEYDESIYDPKSVKHSQMHSDMVDWAKRTGEPLKFHIEEFSAATCGLYHCADAFAVWEPEDLALLIKTLQVSIPFFEPHVVELTLKEGTFRQRTYLDHRQIMTGEKHRADTFSNKRYAEMAIKASTVIPPWCDAKAVLK